VRMLGPESGLANVGNLYTHELKTLPPNSRGNESNIDIKQLFKANTQERQCWHV